MTVSLVKRPLVSLVKSGGKHRSELFAEAGHVVYVNDTGVVVRNVVIVVGGVYGGWRTGPVAA